MILQSVRQALSPLPNFLGFYPVVGSWLMNHEPCGLSTREDESPITGNGSRFLSACDLVKRARALAR